MVRYRLTATVDGAELERVIAAVTLAAVKHNFDPDIVLPILHSSNEPEVAQHAAARPVIQRSFKAKVKLGEPKKPWPPEKLREPQAAKKRAARTLDQAWPAKGSIYDVVLGALKDGPKAPEDIRPVLKAHTFSPHSVHSALGRLERAGKAKKAANGTWVAA